MPTLSFQTLSFAGKKGNLEVTLLRNFSVLIPQAEVEKIGTFEIPDPNSLSFPEFKDEEKEKIETKFSFLLEKYFKSLKNKLTGNPTTYIHQNSGIPLIGSNAFGIVYRNSSIIEIKPATSCNLNCIYCSIGEGLQSKKNDFVVEKDYLVEELKKLLTFVGEEVEVHIGVQGEPFLYADIDDLIADLQAMKGVHTISIDTNGTLLSKGRIDRLARFTKLQINFSLDALDEELARKLAGVKNYNAAQIKEIAAYACGKMKKRPVIAPVYVPGFNEEEIEKIILFAQSLKRPPVLGIQNYLEYKTGRKPAREKGWKEFYQMLEGWEIKHKIKLRWKEEDFGIKKTKMLPKPFQEGDIITAVIKCPDRFPDSVVAVAKGRNISVPGCKFKENKEIKVRIVRDKHNIFVGKLV